MITSISSIISKVPKHDNSYAFFTNNVEDGVIKFADRIYDMLPMKFKRAINENSITITGAGTITIDFAVNANTFLCLEIGINSFGFYSDLPDGTTPEGFYPTTEISELPPAFLNALEKLYGK